MYNYNQKFNNNNNNNNNNNKKYNTNNSNTNNMNNNKKPIIHIPLNTEFIDKIQNCMLSSKNLSKFTKYQNSNENNQDIKKNNNNNNNNNIYKKKQETFCSHFKDTLFWCLYVIKMGIDKYDMIENQQFVIEKEMKFKYIELLRSNKILLKTHKIKPLYELEDDLANQVQIGLKTFVALCIIEKINIIILDKKKIFEYISNNEEKIHIITKTEQPLKYTLDLNSINNTDEKVQTLRSSYFQLQNIDSSLKSMAIYKLEELIEIANKFGIDIKNENNKKKTKKEIYEQLILQF
jgi:hypothetical protein